MMFGAYLGSPARYGGDRSGPQEQINTGSGTMKKLPGEGPEHAAFWNNYSAIGPSQGATARKGTPVYAGGTKKQRKATIAGKPRRRGGKRKSGGRMRLKGGML